MTGIDLGSLTAKLVVRRGEKIVRAHRMPLPAGTIDDASGLARWLVDWLCECGDFDIRNISLSPPAAMVGYETVDLPASGDMSPDSPELAAKTATEIERLLGADSARASFDSWTTPAEIGLLPKLHLAWTDGEFAARLVAHLARRGWFCSAIDAPGAALARVDLGEEATTENCLLVDIGAVDATFVYRREGHAQFVRSRIPFAATSAAGALAAELGIRQAAAEAILEYCGIGDCGTGGEPRSLLETLVLKRLGPWLESLSFEIERTLRYGHRVHPGNSVWAVGLCGGGACLRGLDKWLAQRLRVAVHLAESPEKRVWTAAEPFSPRYALAASLANREEV